MQNAIWKVTALAGLVGIGFLVVLQRQRGLPMPGDSSGGTPSAQSESTEDDGSARADSAAAADATTAGEKKQLRNSESTGRRH